MIAILVLLVFPRFENRVDRIRKARSYRIVLNTSDFKKLAKVEKAIQECSLRVWEHHQTKTEKSITSSWRTIGPPKSHEKLIAQMLRDKDIKELDY